MKVKYDLYVYDKESAGLAHARQLILNELGYVPKNGIAFLDWPDAPEPMTNEERADLEAANIQMRHKAQVFDR